MVALPENATAEQKRKAADERSVGVIRFMGGAGNCSPISRSAGKFRAIAADGARKVGSDCASNKDT